MKMQKIKTFYSLLTNKNTNFRKIINIIKIETSIILRRPKLWGYPYICQIEPTNLCNLRCPTCPTGTGKLKRAKGNMSFKTYKKVVDEIGPYLYKIILMNYGEPFLNPKIYDMIKYAQSKGIKTLTCTNGHHINAKKVVESGLDELEISLDGIDSKTLAKFRVGANFNKIVDNIKKIIQEKESQKSNKPKINLQFIPMKHNEDQIEDFKLFAKKLEVDSVSIKSLWVDNIKDAKKFMPKNPKYHRYIIKEDSFEKKSKKENFCRKPWSEIVINWDGSVALCCVDYDNKVFLGNINNNKIRNILNCNKSVQIRKLMLKRRSSIPICKNCVVMNGLSTGENL